MVSGQTLDTTGALAVTERQLELLRTIRRWSLEHGRMPSIRELAQQLDRSASTIHQHLGALEKRGLIARSGESHGLRLTVPPEALELPESGAGAMVPLKGFLSPGRRLQRSPTPYPRLSVGGDTRRSDYLLQIVGERLHAEGERPDRPGEAAVVGCIRGRLSWLLLLRLARAEVVGVCMHAVLGWIMLDLYRSFVF